MKYMGSKRAMLQNGLGKLLQRELAGAQGFTDLFAGSGSVASFAAQNFSIPVRAFDLQRYSVVVTGALIERSRPLDWKKAWDDWFNRASVMATPRLPRVSARIDETTVHAARRWCSRQSELAITRAYGGHYFSSKQAVWLDCLRATLPRELQRRRVALAALIKAASQCVASPGHTAQPFQPTVTALPFLIEAWSRDVVSRTRANLEILAATYACVPGSANQLDANAAAGSLSERDVAFIDPPYSGVHYSRFYHVLETVALGGCGDVSGIGRYPSSKLRPRSRYSVKSESKAALSELLTIVANNGAKAILTFPDHECSNGLSGADVRHVAHNAFKMQEHVVETSFSTLGGQGAQNGKGRLARRRARELILILKPRC
jgi:adenine-specific DNA-methyltransferase